MRKIVPFGFLIATLLVSPAVFAIQNNCPTLLPCRDACFDSPTGICQPTTDFSEAQDTGWVSCKRPNGSIFSCELVGGTVHVIKEYCVCTSCPPHTPPAIFCKVVNGCTETPVEGTDYRTRLECREEVIEDP
jgi:hypothetical protein